jgi:hypothetical protein
MKDAHSPEERLLKLIRKEKKSKAEPSPLSSGQERVAHSAAPRLFTMRQLYRGMVVAAAASFLYLIAVFVYPWVGLKEIRLPAVTEQEHRDAAIQAAVEPKPYEFYQKELGQKNIFKTQVAEGETSAAIPTDINLTKEINLVGIISGDNPQAIIEDRQTQKTYYVAKGQFIGDYKVADIQEGKIILEFQGKRYELNM